MHRWWIIGAMLLGAAGVGAQTNNWVNTGSGFWDVAANWSQGLPAATQAVCRIGNAFTKTVTIDDVTAQFHPQTLTISNLVIVGVGGATNTLAVANSGALVPLLIRSNLTMATASALRLTNGVVQVQGRADVDGLVEFREGGVLRVPLGTTQLGGVNPVAVQVRGGTLATRTLGISLRPPSTLTISSGRVEVERKCQVPAAGTGTGMVWVTGGSLLNTNLSAELLIGLTGVGQLTLSNGLVAAYWVDIGRSGGTGTLTVRGGTFAAGPLLEVGGNGGSGAVWLTGGQVVLTNSPATVTSDTGLFVDGHLIVSAGQVGISNGVAIVGQTGEGTLTVQGGTVALPDLSLGFQAGTRGTLRLTNGVLVCANGYGIGDGPGATAAAWITGGQLLATNSNGHVIVGYGGAGELTVSNGVIRTRRLQAGTQAGSVGTFTIAGGSIRALEHFLLGNAACTATGLVHQTGGDVVVTNATGTAPLNVQTGTFTLGGGTLHVDRLVVTNSCARFIWSGGALTTGAVVLTPGLDADGDALPNDWEQLYGLPPLRPSADEDADGDGQTDGAEFRAGTDPTDPDSLLRITAIERIGNDIHVTWQTALARTNIVQHTGELGGGVFTNLSGQIFTTTTSTNYRHSGGALLTNQFYRVRVVP